MITSGSISTASHAPLTDPDSMQAGYAAQARAGSNVVFSSPAALARVGATSSSTRTGTNLNPTMSAMGDVHHWGTQFHSVNRQLGCRCHAATARPRRQG